MTNKLQLTAICLLVNFVLAGFIVQTGLLTQSFADSFDVSVVEATKQFSWLYGGYLFGTFLAEFGLDHVRLKTALIIYSVGLVAAAFALTLVESIFLTAGLVGIVGTFGGVSAGIAGTILGKVWAGKHRQTWFLAQDASFNLGGTLYPLVTVVILASAYNWSDVYLFVAAGAAAVLVLTLVTRFDIDGSEGEALQIEAEWNAGILGAGLALFLTIVAKYFIIIWLPNYAATNLSATPAEAGQLISTIFAMALAGSVVGAAIVTRVRLTYFMLAAVFLGFVSSVQFVFSETLDDLFILAGVFGVAIAVLYNVFTAYGVEYVKAVSHKHVAYVLLCGGIAQTIAPYLSSSIADAVGVAATLKIGSSLYVLVIALLLALEFWKQVVHTSKATD